MSKPIREGGFKICPSCGKENLDFKIFCGHCGKTMEDRADWIEIQKRTSSQDDASRHVKSRLDSLGQILGDSKGFGLLIFVLPLILTILTFPIFIDLVIVELVSPALIYGFMIIIIMELIFLAGITLFNDEWRIRRLENLQIGIIAFFLFFALAPLVILGLTGIFGHIPTELAAIIAVLVLALVVWILFFWMTRRHIIQSAG